jgi:hypothetical protein
LGIPHILFGHFAEFDGGEDLLAEVPAALLEHEGEFTEVGAVQEAAETDGNEDEQGSAIGEDAEGQADAVGQDDEVIKQGDGDHGGEEGGAEGEEAAEQDEPSSSSAKGLQDAESSRVKSGGHGIRFHVQGSMFQVSGFRFINSSQFTARFPRLAAGALRLFTFWTYVLGYFIRKKGGREIKNSKLKMHTFFQLVHPVFSTPKLADSLGGATQRLYGTGWSGLESGVQGI